VDEKAGLLRFAEGWSVPGDAIERFIAGSRDVTYAPGAGWRDWHGVLNSRYGLPTSQGPARSPGEARARYRHAWCFSFSSRVGGESGRRFHVQQRQIRDPDERLLQAIRVIGNQIGQFVKRKQAEDVVRESEERFRSLTELSSDMYWTQDSEHRFTRFPEATRRSRCA